MLLPSYTCRAAWCARNELVNVKQLTMTESRTRTLAFTATPPRRFRAEDYHNPAPQTPACGAFANPGAMPCSNRETTLAGSHNNLCSFVPMATAPPTPEWLPGRIQVKSPILTIVQSSSVLLASGK